MACDDLDLVTVDVRTYDGCPALSKLKLAAFSRTQTATLEWQLRDRRGATIGFDDLDDVEVVLKCREALTSGVAPFSVTADITDSTNGIVQATITSDITAQPGVLEAHWAVLCGGELKLNQQCYFLVEDSLHGLADLEELHGPPTIEEIRTSLLDYRAANLFLEDIEFDDADIGHALIRPVRYFNEVPPPLCRRYNTTNFPPREHWRDATIAHLFRTAADRFRRTHMPYSAGGISVDDQNKEREYLAASQARMEEWQTWVVRKKFQLNCQEFSGSISSPYSWL